MVLAFTEINTTTINNGSIQSEPLVALSAPNSEITEEKTSNFVLYSMISEPTLQLKEFLARPVLLSTITAGTYTSFPLAIFTTWQSHFLKKLAGYQFFRGCLRITLIYSGCPTMLGETIVFFYPQVEHGTSEYSISTVLPSFMTGTPNRQLMVQYSCLPNLTIEYEQYCTKSICLPFPKTGPAMTISTDNDWVLAHFEVVPALLNNGATPVAPVIDIYASYEDVDLFGPIFAEMGEVDSRWISRSLSYLSTLLGTAAGSFPFITPYHRMTQAAYHVAEAMGFSRPLLPAQTVEVMRQQTTLSYVSGQPDFSEKLSLDPSVCLDTSGSKIPLSRPNDTSLDFFVKDWSLLASNYFVNNGFNCHPMAIHALNTDTTFSLHKLAMASSMFKYWTGSLEYKFVFVANALLRQRVAIYVVPPNQTAPSSYTTSIGYLTTLVNISGRTEVIVKVPYFAVTNYLSVLGHLDNMYSGVSLDTTKTRIVLVYIDSAQGFTGTPPNIPYNVYVRGGPDFELACPSCENMTDYVIQQSGRVNVSTFGENVKDLLQLTRRPCLAMQLQSVPSIFALPMFPVQAGLTSIGLTGGVSTAITVDATRNTFTSWLGSCYMGCTGGSRWKLFSPGGVGTWRATVGLQPVGGNTILPALAPNGRGFSIQQRSDLTEVEVPSLTIGNFTFAARYFGVNGASWKPCDGVIFYLVSSTGPTNVDCYHSTADDFVLRGFLCPPVVKTVY